MRSVGRRAQETNWASGDLSHHPPGKGQTLWKTKLAFEDGNDSFQLKEELSSSLSRQLAGPLAGGIGVLSLLGFRAL